ncbi:MAG TPA: GNAT family N-acetyltransferase [Geminicoccaceae bacterium]|nr:GNAT family N-acetyltransferase [Geminicoccaceae bacterium]
MTDGAARIRPARPEDAEAIVRLAALLEAEEGTGACRLRPEHVRAHGFGEGRLFSVLVAERGGGLVGYALFYPSFDVTHAAKGFYLNDLFVVPAERGRRTGRALMRAVARACFAQGGQYLFWNALASNARARGFYRHLGAREEPVVTFALHGEPMLRLARGGD